jgi:hypothetical protein
MLRRVDDINNIRYHIYEEAASVQYPTTTSTSVNENENEKEVTETNSSNSQNETILLAFHSSLICFKIALCILL